MRQLINKPIVQLIKEITIKDIVKLYIAREVAMGLISFANKRLDRATERLNNNESE
jgi:hypothetical protein